VREYETTIIVQPEISTEGTEALLSKVDGVLERGKSVRLMCADLGKRKLAYEIRKFHKGHYYTLSFCDKGQVIPDLERSLRMEESVLRFMTVMVDEEVTDIETRQARGRELEADQQKRAVEKAEREAEEAAARAEVERLAADERARAAEASEGSESEASEEASSEGDAAEAADVTAATEAGGESEAAAESGDAPAPAEEAAAAAPETASSDEGEVKS
jgi:small subunit ribosomal protein S6